MWRDIRITTEDLNDKGGWSKARIRKTFGLSHDELRGLLNRRGQAAARQKQREHTMVDPTDREIEGMQHAAAIGGEYLDSIAKTDLADLAQEEYMTFVEVVITGYLDRVNETNANGGS